MPVLITGATGFIGRALAHRLLQDGAQVRAYLRRDDAALRAAGVHIAIGPADEVPPLEAALTNVHTIVHLVGGWWPERRTSYDWLNRDTTETAVIAAKSARVRRFVLMSFPGADPASPNPFLAAKGRAERHVLESGLPYVIFRSAPVLGDGAPLIRALARARRGPVAVLGAGRSPSISAIGLADAVEALLAADERDEHLDGIWELGGATPVTLDDIAARAGLPRVGRLGALSGVPAALVDLLGRDIVVDPAPLEQRFGLRPAAPL